MAENPIKTLVVDNFGGRLTRYDTGDINSGYAKFSTTFGNDPFTSPGRLGWFESPTRIDPNGSVITDLIVAGKERVESGIAYVYAIGHTGRFYKIQVNDPSSFNPNYDNPVLLATLSFNSPTFTRGGSIEFFGSTERAYIGHDKGVTRIDLDGTNETFVGALGSWTQTCPRPMEQFIGNLYVGNGSNLVEINSSATVTTYTKLSPGFPDNTQVRDIDISPDGNYLQIIVTRLALADITATTQDTSILGNTESYRFQWNGTDTTYTAYDIFPTFSLTANTTFGNYAYTFGYDLTGGVVYNPLEKILTPALAQSPLPNAVGSNGNILAWTVPEFDNGFLSASQFLYGSLDNEVRAGWFRQFKMTATGAQTDVQRVPFSLIVSNFLIGSATSGYSGGVAGSAKIYFSTMETSAAPTTAYKLYKFFPIQTGTGTSMAGVYETQTQLFSKKVKISQIRLYTEPLTTNNSFTVALIGPDGNAITGSSKTFTVGSNVTAGQDYVWYNPEMAPTYAVGLRITNAGSANWVALKAEIDYAAGGI